MFHWQVILALLIGSMLAAPFGAFTTRSLKKEKMHYILGVLISAPGAWTLIKTWL